VFELTPDLTGNGYCESGEAMQEVRRAIERIDDPDGIAVSRAPALLSQESMAWIVLADQLDDLGLGRMIDFADEIVASLGCDRQGFEAIEAADDDFAGGAGGTYGNIEERMHSKISSRSVSACANSAAETNQRIVTD
jgi:hypothetical protein